MGPRATIDRVRGSGAAVLHAPARARSAIVGLRFGTRRRDAADGSLDELAGLAAAAGTTVSFRTLQERSRPDSACFLGRGKVRQIAAPCDEFDIDLVAVDAELTPGRSRNLEQEIGRRVVDRTQLILDILAARARSREGSLRVESAQRHRDLRSGRDQRETDRRRAVTAVLGVDTRRVRLRFDGRLDRDRRRISAAYRHGRVLRHEHEGGTVSMEVEGPLEVVERWRRDGWGREPRCS